MILAGDIGGTSTRLGLFKPVGQRLQLVAEQTWRSGEYDSLDDIVSDFTARHPAGARRACFGIAGPVLGGVVRTPNLPWTVEARALARILALERVALVNDLEANAYGIAALSSEEFVTLNPGTPGVSGNAAVISAGTGLGEAGLYWDGKDYQPFACEGGHADFAPGSDLEIELLRYLRARFGHVSWERVLSGPGLHNIYRFLRDTGPGAVSAQLEEQMTQGDPARVISEAAMAGRCALCGQALDLFVSIYGAAAGNLALKMMARGGLYVGGGIAPKILRKLQGPIFLQAFFAKGRMRPLMESIPVRVLTNDKAALYGAARFAQLSA